MVGSAATAPLPAVPALKGPALAFVWPSSEPHSGLLVMWIPETRKMHCPPTRQVPDPAGGVGRLLRVQSRGRRPPSHSGRPASRLRPLGLRAQPPSATSKALVVPGSRPSRGPRPAVCDPHGFQGPLPPSPPLPPPPPSLPALPPPLPSTPALPLCTLGWGGRSAQSLQGGGSCQVEAKIRHFSLGDFPPRPLTRPAKVGQGLTSCHMFWRARLIVGTLELFLGPHH